MRFIYFLLVLFLTAISAFGLDPEVDTNNSNLESSSGSDSGHTPEIERNYPSTYLTIQEGESVNFSADLYDQDGDLNFTEWYEFGTFLEHNDVSGYNDTDNFSRSFNEHGVFDISCYVYDEQENQSFTWWRITVMEPVPPDIDRNFPSKNTTVQIDEDVDFSVDVSDDNADLNFTEWYDGNTPLVNHNVSGSEDTDSYSMSFDDSGSYVISCYVYDDLLQDDDLYWNITIAPSVAPEIEKDYPSSSSITVSTGSSIEFSVEVFDDNGDLDFTEWYNGNTFLENNNVSGSHDTDDHSISFNTPGNYNISCYVYDDQNNHSFTQWSVTVPEPVAPEIERNYPDSLTTVYLGDTVEFSVDISDADGDLNFTEWYSGNTLLDNHNVSGSQYTDTYSITFDQLGEFGISCYIYDDLNQEAFTWWTVTVIMPPGPSIEKDFPSANVSAQIDDAIDFSVNLSDPSGDLNFTEWYEDNTFLENHPVSGYEDTDSYTHTFSEQGEYELSCYVYDELLQEASTIWTVDVAEPVSPVVQRAFPDSIAYVQKGEQFQLAIEAVDDNGDLSFSEWYIWNTFIENHQISGYEVADTLSYTLNEYICTSFSAYVYDNQGNDDWVQWYLIVLPSVDPEIERIAPDSVLSLTPGTQVDFSIALIDSNGDLNFTEWYEDSTFLENHSVSSYEDTDSFTRTFNDYGEFLVSAYVYDNELNENFTWWQVTVEDPQPPEVEIIAPDTAYCTVGDFVEFVAEATDINGDLALIEWYAGNTFADSSAIEGYSILDTLQLQFNEVGTVTILTSVFDILGNHAEDSYPITVLEPSSSPQIDTLFALPDVFIYTGQEVTCTGTASDVDGDLSLLEWYLEGNLEQSLIVSGTSVTDSFKFTFTSTGTYPVLFYAYDSENNHSFESIDIHVTTPPELPPIVTRLYPDSLCYNYPCQQITFAVEASDPNGNLNLIKWFDGNICIDSLLISGESFTDSLELEFSATGTHMIRCRVYDEAGNMAMNQWCLDVTVPDNSIVFFDDFTYASTSEMTSSVNQWVLQNSGAGRYIWNPGLVSLMDDREIPGNRLLLLPCFTRGDCTTTFNTGIRTSEYFALMGTYASRVMFDEGANFFDPGHRIVQTFYSYCNTDQIPTPADFSEIDIEYVPFGWDNYYIEPRLEMVSWADTSNSQLVGSLTGSLSDEWTPLLFQVDSTSVHFRVNGVHESTGGDFYPDCNMNLMLNAWFFDVSESVMPFSAKYLFKVDYVFYCENEVLSQQTTDAIVAHYRSNGIQRINGFISTIDSETMHEEQYSQSDCNTGIEYDFNLAISPNPANSALSIRLSTPWDGNARVRAFSVDGRCVAELLSEEVSAGMHYLQWDTSCIPSGVYYVRAECSNMENMTKCLVLHN